jgi:hypothetical protein
VGFTHEVGINVKGGLGKGNLELMRTPGARQSFSHWISIAPHNWPNGDGVMPGGTERIGGPSAPHVVGPAAERLQHSAKGQLEQLGHAMNAQFIIEDSECEKPYRTIIIQIRLLAHPAEPENLARARAMRERLVSLGVNAADCGSGPPFDDNALMGLLLALAVEAVDSVLIAEHVDQAVFCGHEYFSLPFLYLVKALGRPGYRTLGIESRRRDPAWH